MAFEFNTDGSLKVPGNDDTVNSDNKGNYTINTNSKNKSNIEPIKITPEQKVLKLINRMQFPVGRKLLAEILHGDMSLRIKQLRLNHLLEFGALDLFDYKDIYNLIDDMLFDGLIEVAKLREFRYMPVIKITSKGNQELINPTKKRAAKYNGYEENLSGITEQDRELFKAFGEFLEKYNDEQKKAIIDYAKNILCIAGAGTGKTTVLTKRIEYLVKLKNVPANNILAITFTRKARLEMKQRLKKLLPGQDVHIETFNSFCEKTLRKNAELAYGREYKVMNFSAKIRLVLKAVEKLGYTTEEAVRKYFSERKVKTEETKTLFFTFVNDIFSLMDHYANNEKPLFELQDMISSIRSYKDKTVASFVYKIIQWIITIKEKLGLRDFTDQIVHTLKLFEKHKETIPKFEHVLVDEYQDVNNLQVKLLDLLEPKNQFVVGDPRQSIYGWRGSKLKYILKFSENYKDCSIIQLTKNYRSTKNIVNVGNRIIDSMKLPDLQSAVDTEIPIVLIKHDNESKEAYFIAQSILAQDIPRNEIFILARTNRHLENIAGVLQQNNIQFLKRTVEEQKVDIEPTECEVTLSTVHAIKGLEAELVYMTGVTSNMYPCMTSDHPVLSAVKIDEDYDKYNEEIRLLYVGMTRARKKLVVSYFNNLSRFVNSSAVDLMTSANLTNNTGAKNTAQTYSSTKTNNSPFQKYKTQNSGKVHANELVARIRRWRLDTSKKKSIFPYQVFSDKTMFELVAVMPSSLDELETVNGFGPAKISQYGYELLEILHS